MLCIVNDKEINAWIPGTPNIGPIVLREVTDVEPPVKFLSHLLAAASEAKRLTAEYKRGVVTFMVDDKKVGYAVLDS